MQILPLGDRGLSLNRAVLILFRKVQWLQRFKVQECQGRTGPMIWSQPIFML